MLVNRYALLWDGSERSGSIIGTPEEIARRFCRAKEIELMVGTDEDGDLYYFTKEAGQETWDCYDALDNTGSPERNLAEAYAAYFEDCIRDAYVSDDYMIFGITGPQQETAFTAPVVDLLGRITAKEYVDNYLDVDDEFELRRWYYENKSRAA